MQRFHVAFATSVLIGWASATGVLSAQGSGLQISDLPKFRSVAGVGASPDGRKVAYGVEMRDRPGRPYSQLWIMDVTTQQAQRVGGEEDRGGTPLWSPDGKWLAYMGGHGDQAGLWIVQPDGSGATFLAPVMGTNTALPGQGATVTWSPDSRQIAFVSATPGPETEAADGDPRVITRYMYKPGGATGTTLFGDNRRLHIFIVDVDVAGHQVRQLTNGTHDEHSIDWSPDGKEILFASDYEPNQDEFFHYDVFAVAVADGHIRRLTSLESTAYGPRWSPDGKWIVFAGTKRGFTDRETTMEDTHIWLMDPTGGHRHEITGAIDNRQGHPQWSPEGTEIWFTVQGRGSNHLVRIPVSTAGVAGSPQTSINDVGTVGAFSVGKRGFVAYIMATPRDLPEVYVKGGLTAPRQMTKLNDAVLAGKPIAKVDSLTFVSNDGHFTVEAFLTEPLGLEVNPADTFPAKKYPLILNIHGGPHGQQGPAFVFQDQVYAAHGFATLAVNYRGSTGYGQQFADALLGDMDGEEAQDVMYGVSAAVRQNLWIDRDRMAIEGGSYGGQLTDWIITQTNEFKAAVPDRSISNLVSNNYTQYMSSLWETSEYGVFLTQGNVMEQAWDHSAMKYVANVHTPVMFIHGEDDADVPISNAEQYYVALKDVGVETMLVRYPREGHGLRETGHIMDDITRKLGWYDDHFARVRPGTITNVQP